MKRISALFFLIANLVFAGSINVITSSFYVDLAKPETENIEVFNDSSDPIRVEISVGNSTGEKIPDSEYLGKWIRISPRIVTVPPKSSAMARFLVSAPKDIKDGEYKAVIFIKEMESEEAKQARLSHTNAHVGFALTLGVPVYGAKGDLKTVIDMKKLKVSENDEGYQLNGVYTNNGDRSLRYDLMLEFYKGSKLLGKSPTTRTSLKKGMTSDIKIPFKTKKKITGYDKVKVVLNSVNTDYKNTYWVNN